MRSSLKRQGDPGHAWSAYFPDCGSIVWFNGSDPLCTGNAYSAGQSFIEDAYVTHNVTSAGGAEFVAIVIKPAGFEGSAFRLNRDKPNNCNF